MRRVYLGGGDEISSYSIGELNLVMYLTSVAVSILIVQVGALLRLCFEPTITVTVGSKHSLNKTPTCTLLIATLVKYITRLCPPIL